MATEIRVIQSGAGPIGASVARLSLGKPRVTFVGTVGIDPTNIGQDPGHVIQGGRELGVTISDQAAIVPGTDADLVIHSRSSYLTTVGSRLYGCIAAGRRVVSPSEEGSYPFRKHPQRTARLDAAARQRERYLARDGHQPGFLDG